MLYQMANPHGGDIYQRNIVLDFSANVNPLGTPPGVLAAVTASLDHLACYPDPNCTRLVAAIGSHEQVEKEHILCGNGAAELIYAYCAALRPRRAMELAPTFCEYSLALETVGCRTERYLLSAENDFALTEDFPAALVETRPEVLFLCNPNNPTGRTIPAELLERILKVCAREGIRLFLDECFADLSDRAVTMKAWLRRYSNLFILRAFTKTYAMAGLRLGYGLCADGELLGAMAKQVQPWNVSVPAQAAGIAALEEGEYLDRARTLIACQRRALEERLKAMGYRVCASEANYLLFYSPRPLTEPLLARGIALRDCANYPGLGKGWYRIAVRSGGENETLLAALGCI